MISWNRYVWLLCQDCECAVNAVSPFHITNWVLLQCFFVDWWLQKGFCKDFHIYILSKRVKSLYFSIITQDAILFFLFELLRFESMILYIKIERQGTRNEILKSSTNVYFFSQLLTDWLLWPHFPLYTTSGLYICRQTIHNVQQNTTQQIQQITVWRTCFHPSSHLPLTIQEARRQLRIRQADEQPRTGRTKGKWWMLCWYDSIIVSSHTMIVS